MRAQPLDKPCLGSAQIHNVCVWVPFRTVWEPFSDFITDVPHNQPSGTGIIPNVPRLPNTILLNVFILADYSTAYSTEPQVYDFYYNNTYYILKPKGQQALKILESLGYKLVPGAKDPVYFSALPLLCLVKAYLDYYFPQAYAHYGVFATVDGIMQRQITYDLTVTEVNTLLTAIQFVGYNDDFYSAVWDNPSGPNTGVGSVNFSISDLTSPYPYSQGSSAFISNAVVNQFANGTPAVYGEGTNSSGSSSYPWPPRLTQYLDSSLKALSLYVKRHQLSSFTIDRYLTEYGISLDVDKLKRSVFIGDDQFPFEIGDVMSNSDTSADGGASLGAYAGKGIGFSNGKVFDFNVQEFGYLFVLNSIVPDISYTQGIDKNVMCKTKLDFITGEFDGLGPDMVTRSELLVDLHGTNINQDACTAAFGFAPRYYQWKIPYDRLTGSFRYQSINADLNGWFTNRLFDPDLYNSDPNSFVHSMDFVLGEDYTQYDRIFLGYSSDDVTDPFFVVHRDEMTMYAPMRPLYEDCLFDDEDSSTVVSERVGGVKVN